MQSLRPLVPLLTAAGILLAGNGLQGTLIALRGAAEGFSPALIGFMGTAYFGGFMLGCIFIPRILRAVGHIRAFSALAAIAAAASLMLVLAPDAYLWLVIRFVTGFCFSGLFTTVESWINSGVDNTDRARVLSLYRIIDIAAVTGSQYLIPAFGPEGFAIFAIMAMMITLSLVPVSLADRSNPTPPEAVSLDLTRVWRISPIACMGCIAIGMTNGAFRLIGPIYANDVGMDVTDVATFMGAGIFGGAVLQYPLGYLSDRYDRRRILIISTLGAVFAGIAITLFAGSSVPLNIAGIFLFGAFALPLYSLSAAHANDHAKQDDFVHVAAGLMLFFSVGAMVGPPVAAYLMEQFGPGFLFFYTSAVHASLILVTLYRMQVRHAVPLEGRSRFRMLLRTSPEFAKRKSEEQADKEDG